MAMIQPFTTAQAAGQTGAGAPPAMHALMADTGEPACGRTAPLGWIGHPGGFTTDRTRVSCPWCLAALSQPA
jgi:hypothetical protein